MPGPLATRQGWSAGSACLELKIDAAGIFSRDWRGVIPWSAIDFVAKPNDTDTTYKRLRLALKSQALSALRAAYPDLEVRGPRSAGLVLPVRAATDVVEADL